MLLNLTSEEPLFGRTFKKALIKKMVKTYRLKHPDDLHYAHFGVKELLSLFVENDVLPASVLSQIKTSPNGNEYGLKIYIGNHCTPESYQGYANYKDANTTILCNTEIINKTDFLDILDDTKKTAFLMPIDDPGDGLDQATICPPDCPKSEPTPPFWPDGYDVGHN